MVDKNSIRSDRNLVSNPAFSILTNQSNFSDKVPTRACVLVLFDNDYNSQRLWRHDIMMRCKATSRMKVKRKPNRSFFRLWKYNDLTFWFVSKYWLKCGVFFVLHQIELVCTIVISLVLLSVMLFWYIFYFCWRGYLDQSCFNHEIQFLMHWCLIRPFLLTMKIQRLQCAVIFMAFNI